MPQVGLFQEVADVFPETSAKFAPEAAAPLAAGTPGRAQLLARLPALASEIAKDAARRDRERELPFEAFALFRQSGLGTLRIPTSLGGPGGSIPDYVELIATLAAADSNVAHALRSHFNFTESLILAPNIAKARAYLSKVLEGKLFGGAAAELGTARPGDIENTKLVREGDHYRLNGKKYYATGTAFADYASFGALDENGKLVSALVPTDREGVHILDDWDGMGQRLTASGGVDLVDVVVQPHEIGERSQSVMTGLIGRHTSALRQLHLLACVNGIVRNILSDGVEYVRKSARTTRHAEAAKAVDDVFVQQVTGGLAATVFAVDAIVAEAARVMGLAADALAAEAPDAEQRVLESALATARAQLVAGRLGLRAAEEMFEIGGGSTASRKYNFDRHWRNIRTILSHNPLNHKARVVGDYYLNGTETHLREGRVF